MKNRKEKWHKIAEEYVASPFPQYTMEVAFTSDIKNVIGKSVSHFLNVYKNHSVQYHVYPSEWEKASKYWARRIFKDLKLLKNAYQGIIISCQRLIKYAKKISQTDLSQKSNLRLASLIRKYNEYNTRAFTWGLTLPLLDFQDMSHLTLRLEKLLKKLKKRNFSQDFVNFTTPLKETEASKQEKELLKILQVLERKKGIEELFRNKPEEIWPSLPKNIKRLILSHEKKYNYVNYVYEGPALKKEDFILMLKDYLSRNVKAKTKLKEIGGHKKELIQQEKNFLKKYKIDAYHKKFIKLIRDFGFYKVWRRERQSQSYYLIENLLKEIAKRLNISLNQLRFMLVPEVIKVLRKGKVDNTFLNERKKFSVIYFVDGKTNFYKGKEARDFLKNIEKEKIDKKLKKLKGTTACSGKVRGVVRIINAPEDMKKMKKWDILVSFATNPNLMPAIRQAGAIITNEGGLTCHAAIVSRELKIPCVIGTKIATKVLRDGDKVEVEANKGIVKRIRGN